MSALHWQNLEDLSKIAEELYTATWKAQEQLSDLCEWIKSCPVRGASTLHNQLISVWPVVRRLHKALHAVYVLRVALTAEALNTSPR